MELGDPNSPRFAEVAHLAGVTIDQVAFAIAAELGPAAIGPAEAELDAIAADLGDLGTEPPALRARLLAEHLERRAGFRERLDRDPEALMLDRVVTERRGHPYALAAVHIAVAERCGIQLFGVVSGSMLLVGERNGEEVIVIDPVPGGRVPRHRPAWACPHVVARMLLGAIGTRLEERGDLRRATRVAEMAGMLPLHAARRARDETVLRGLLSRLN
jgi:hypothetical protein